MKSFQARVQGWMQVCFGPVISADKMERNDRFLEEALELVQSLGCTSDRAEALVAYVFGRDRGEPAQEVGGVMVTLAALCEPNGLDMFASGETELARILAPDIVEKIRVKQAGKPTGSALPVPAQADYLVWSNEHRAWWGPNSCGYYYSIEHAGRYTRGEALAIAKGARNGWTEDGRPDEMAVPLADALYCVPEATNA